MKTIIKPGTPEIVQYRCDVTGVPLPDGPAASIAIHCGYGSPYDGSDFVLDLSEQAAEVVLPLFRSLLLGGAPLAPHVADQFLNQGPLNEKRISRRERVALLRRLDKLCRNKRRNLALRCKP